MQVLILNESSKNALLRSRRVLSKFLPQLGSTTWGGAISAEGLEDLRLALKASGISKASAISCLRVEGRGRLEPQWVLGSSTAFDSSGRFAFRQTKFKKPPQPPEQKSAVQRFALALLKLAGLAHDTGKASRAFQEKLRRGYGAEAIRHELLSFLVVAHSLWKPGVSEESWLTEVAANPRALVGCVGIASNAGVPQLLPSDSPWLQRVLEALQSMRRAKADSKEGAAVETKTSLALGSEIQELMTQAPGLATLLWQVLAHHRLPASDPTAQAWWAADHLHLPSEAAAEFLIADVPACLDIAQGTPPWEDSQWLASVSGTAATALRALAELKAETSTPLDPATWALLNAHYLRPALILADHLGSQRAKKSSKKSAKKAEKLIFANTIGSTHFGDTLADHELAVGRLTRQIVALYSRAWPTAELPPSSYSVTRDLAPPFQWQLGLEDACSAAREHGPAFVSIIAETGAGKTLGGLRAANALGAGRLRLTMALGLRSLTQQTAQAAVADAQLPETTRHADGTEVTNLVVAVGNPQTLALADQARDNERARFGSDSAEGQELDATVVTAGAPNLDWLEGFCSTKEAPLLWGKKQLDMLAAPVLACTADYLVRSATMLRGGDAKLYLRLASADLLLDEVDAYSARDTQTVGKLVFISGLHGRNVILMSATMSPAVRNGLYHAWYAGVQARAQLAGGDAAHTCAFSSNTIGSTVQHSSSLIPDSAWAEYVDTVTRAYAKAAAEGPRRKLEVAPIAPNGTAAEAFEVITATAKSLHRRHHVTDPDTGVRVSVGFARLNTAKNAWNCAQYLANRAPDDVEVRFVAYHSKFPRTYLGALDHSLRELTNRKKENQFLSVPELREALVQTKARGAQDLMVLVCTTTLIETGRDFDFDWAVLEPRSVRGEVQATGRVLRHRRSIRVDAPNVAILSHPLRVLQPSTAASVWARPGVEDELAGLRVQATFPETAFKGPALSSSSAPKGPRQPLKKSVYVTSCEAALPLAAWSSGIDASLCLAQSSDYAANRLGVLEQRVQAVHLTDPSPWVKGACALPPSLPFYLGTLASLNKAHALETPFRGHKAQQLAFIPYQGKIQYFDERAAQAQAPLVRRRAVEAQWLSDAAVPSEGALFPQLQDAADALYSGTDQHIDGCSLRCNAHEGSLKKLCWHPLLGFREDS